MFSRFVIVPLLAAAIAQGSKFFIRSNRTSFSWKALVAYSGMPSSHAAITVSLAAIIGLEIGWNSPTFGIALIFALITIRDASGLRRQLGRQGQVLNELTKELDDDRIIDDPYPRLTEKIGHTPAQLAVGAVIGLFTALLANWLLPNLY